MNKINLKYRPEIDGLRAIAVTAVILFHAEITIFGQPLFQGGFIGVDIFFVISGYLITSIILKELFANKDFSFLNFYKRRIKRILPVLLLVVLVCIPFAWSSLLFPIFIKFINSIFFVLGFTSNYFFELSDLAYFKNVGATSPLLHTWSLSIEEQFYILFPFFLFVSYKYFRKQLGLILLITFLASFFLAEWASKNYPVFNFYSLPTRAWELIAGSILAYLEIKKNKKPINSKYSFILTSLGTLIIFFSFIFFDENIFLPSSLTIIPILGVILILWFSEEKNIFTKLLSSKLFVKTGLISYSLYLWHYPIFIFLKYKYFNFNMPIKIMGIGLSIFFATLSYLYVEQFFRNKAKFKTTILFIIISYVVIFLGLFTILTNKAKIENLIRINNNVFFNSEKALNERNNFLKNYDFNNFTNKKNVFIVGNSYAEDLLYTFKQNLKFDNRFYFYTPIIRKDEKEKKSFHYNFECFLQFIKHKDFTCNGVDFTNHLTKQYTESDLIIFHGFDNSMYINNIRTLNEKMKKDNKKFIILLDDLNDIYLANLNLLERFFYLNKRLPNEYELERLEKKFFKDSVDYQKKILIKLTTELKKYNVDYLSKRDLFCKIEIERCPVITKEKNKIFLDFGHITTEGAKFFSNKTQELLKKIE